MCVNNLWEGRVRSFRSTFLISLMSLPVIAKVGCALRVPKRACAYLSYLEESVRVCVEERGGAYHKGHVSYIGS